MNNGPRWVSFMKKEDQNSSDTFKNVEVLRTCDGA